MSDVYDPHRDLLAHAVSVDVGKINATDLDAPVDCVRLVFHHGRGQPHVERFIAPEAVPELIRQLTSLQVLLEAIKSLS